MCTLLADLSAPQRVILLGVRRDVDPTLDELQSGTGFPLTRRIVQEAWPSPIRVNLDEYVKADPLFPALALQTVPTGVSPFLFAHLLQRDLQLTGNREIVVEPSQLLSLATSSTSGTGAAWTIQECVASPGAPGPGPHRLVAAARDAQQAVTGQGRFGVALLDTGLSSTQIASPNVFDTTTTTVGWIQPLDLVGHGTTMATLLTAGATAAGGACNARIQPYRVMQQASGEMWPLLAALIVACWEDVFSYHADVVSMSLFFAQAGSCSSGLGATLAWLLTTSPPPRGWPLLVAAAGNYVQQLTYPALWPGCLVVGANDWQRRPASYSGPANSARQHLYVYGPNTLWRMHSAGGWR
jgi:Subtilase family